VAAAESFVQGWDNYLDSVTQFVPGLYGSSCASYLSNMTNAPVPAAIAPADPGVDYTGVYGLQCLSDGLWNQNRRIHQDTGEVWTQVRWPVPLGRRGLRRRPSYQWRWTTSQLRLLLSSVTSSGRGWMNMHTPSRLQSGALVAALALPLLGCGLQSDGLSSPSGQPASSSVPTPAPTPSTTPSPSATAAVLPAAFQDSSPPSTELPGGASPRRRSSS